MGRERIGKNSGVRTSAREKKGMSEWGCHVWEVEKLENFSWYERNDAQESYLFAMPKTWPSAEVTHTL